MQICGILQSRIYGIQSAERWVFGTPGTAKYRYRHGPGKTGADPPGDLLASVHHQIPAELADDRPQTC